jgi:hypothetical protein
VVATATATILLWPGAKSESVPTATTPSYSVPTLAEDPAEATTQLLAARSRCLAEQSALCLQDVDDVTAALFLEDQRRIDGESPAVDLSVFDAPWPSATLSERDGDAALVDVERDDEAASVLLIRTAEGWRLRALLPATSPTL